jgi:DNA polymerase-4
VFVSREANILHADLDAFYASVEQRDDPRLRGRPVIVGGGVVLAASYDAKARGVKTAMGGRRAKQLCPDAVVVPARFSAYTEASDAVFDVFRDTTPLVEGLSIDEAFLDVRGMRRIAGTPEQIAERLRREVRERVGLPITVGVACTKFLAKVASAVAKPDGLLVVPPGGELAFLHPLPVERLWGVGPVTAGKLHAHGLMTVGDVARVDEEGLVSLLGRASGRHLHALAHNRDPRRVRTGQRRRSVGGQCALGWRRKSPEAIDAVLVGLVDRICRRLRARRDARHGARPLRLGRHHPRRAPRARHGVHDAAASGPRVGEPGRLFGRDANERSDMDYKLELVAVPVSDVDRAKAFYTEQAGFNADHDHQVSDDLRFVQLTPPGSACSIALGKGITDVPPGSVQGLQLVVSDIEAAHAELSGRGVDVGEVQDFPWGRFVFFKDPDGNGWAVQEIQRPG